MRVSFYADCTLDRFTKTPFLEIHIAQSGFLVLGPTETTVRKCIFQNKDQEYILGNMNFQNLIFVTRSHGHSLIEKRIEFNHIDSKNDGGPSSCL